MISIDRKREASWVKHGLSGEEDNFRQFWQELELYKGFIGEKNRLDTT